MGTYYTEMFENGDPSFAEFMWKRARLHGPLGHMRDYGMDAPIVLPRDSSPDDQSYTQESLQDAFLRRVHYATATDAELQKEIDDSYNQTQQHAKSQLAKYAAIRGRMNKMLSQVENWTPPSSEHVNLKEETVKSLQGGLKDVDFYEEYNRKDLARVKSDVQTWRKDHLEYLDRDIKRYHERIQEENKDQGYVVKWIQDLDASVPAPTHLKGFPSRQGDDDENE